MLASWNRRELQDDLTLSEHCESSCKAMGPEMQTIGFGATFRPEFPQKKSCGVRLGFVQVNIPAAGR